MMGREVGQYVLNAFAASQTHRGRPDFLPPPYGKNFTGFGSALAFLNQNPLTSVLNSRVKKGWLSHRCICFTPVMALLQVGARTVRGNWLKQKKLKGGPEKILVPRFFTDTESCGADECSRCP